MRLNVTLVCSLVKDMAFSLTKRIPYLNFSNWKHLNVLSTKIRKSHECIEGYQL